MALSSRTDELLAGGGAGGPRGGQTGRFVVSFRPGADQTGRTLLQHKAGLKVASALDYERSAVQFGSLDADVIYLPEIRVAIVAGDPRQAAIISAEAGPGGPVIAVEPERFAFAIQDEPPIALPPEARAYLRGYRDGVNNTVAALLASEQQQTPPPQFAETDFTWGLQATNVHQSQASGRGIRVAVLDTGLDLEHPDFAGRDITASSFVPDETPQDGEGHGTHTTGTACGSRTPGVLPRYGIAYEASIFTGKVLGNDGSGTDAWILAGINWAIANGCTAINMSLGRAATEGEPFPVAYETAAQAGLARGTIIVAAAGNESRRSAGVINPVGHPASCPSILAIAAIDRQMRIADFSNRAINPNGGEIDLAAPGVAVRSSYPMPERVAIVSGTSMACPHVVGIAALYAQQSEQLRGAALRARLLETARDLANIPAVDDGRGLVQAPR